MKILIILSLLALTFAMPINTEELQSLWSSWKIYYGKSYGLAEEKARFAIFVENYKRVITNNAVNTDYKLGMNKFADLTGEEFKNLYTGCFKWDGIHNKVSASAKKTFSQHADSVDWRTKGAVTPVKNQGQCGSCWSFSTTGSLEGRYFLDNGKLLSFSEQQIVDCDTTDMGCDGGNMDTAMTYTAANGCETEADYPYTAEDGNCKYSKSETVKVNTGYSWVNPQSAADLIDAVNAAPVSVAIEADQDAFQLYTSGVIKSGCGDSLDHGVLVVGYSTISGTQAFIVKNSWGTDWGDEGGYVYISTNEKPNGGNGVCGILSQPIVPTN